MKEGLVPWKKKLDKYDEEYADDDTECYPTRLHDSMGEPVFIRRDEVNAEAMRKMGMKKWW